MNRNRIFAALLFVTGVATGIGAASAYRPIPAQAQTMSPQSNDQMSMPDMEMNKVMEKMNDSMKSIKMTGNTDKDFMMMMIPHHQSAIGMANVELRHGKNPKVIALARNIITNQQHEISEMESWLRSLF
ncbi:MAG: DUF305 domain-containing protein [Candidatus Eremiobacteraeota bacterium]|nr:DUF305 domain-containing protein [Candidatus Eremiobacteraeota bacterium]